MFVCNYVLYADDTAIYSSRVSPQAIMDNIQQSVCNILFDYFVKWKIKINAERLQAIFFSRKRSSRKFPNSNFIMNSTDIPWSNNVRYLGVFLDRTLCFNVHTIPIITMFNLAIQMLYPLINRKSELNTSNKITIVKTVFQAITLYDRGDHLRILL